MSVLKEWTVGAHHIQLEEGDVLRVSYLGAVQVEEVERIVAIMREVAVDRRIFVISDVSKSTIEKTARDYFSQNIRPEWFHGLIYVGADALQRAMAKAIVIALYFTGKWKVDIEFASTEEEARRMVTFMRRVREAEARGGRDSGRTEPPRAQA